MNYKIPLFKLNFDEREENAILSVIRSQWISMGPKTQEFENKFAEMLSCKYALSLSNCTSALHLALKILEIQAGDEVICPSLTFVATVNSIRYVGGLPIFADIKSKDDLTIDPVDIERKITSGTKAIIVMHYGGFSANMNKIREIANNYNLKIIEDACHAPLSEYEGKKLGTIGDIGCFSFFSNKNISTGEGGMITTLNTDYYNKGKILRSHGMTSMSFERAKGHATNYDVIELGYNYRMDDLRSAIGMVQLEKLSSDLIKREKVRKSYINYLSKCDKIIIPFQHYSEKCSNYIFPIILKYPMENSREIIRTKLAEFGIQTSVHYPAVHRFSIYKDFYLDLPHTDYVAQNLITLPMYGSLSDNEIEYVSIKLMELLNEY